MLVTPQPAAARAWDSADMGAGAGLVITPVRRSKRTSGSAKGGASRCPLARLPACPQRVVITRLRRATGVEMTTTR